MPLSLRPDMPKSAGRAVEIAAITKYEDFRWVQRKSFYPVGTRLEGRSAASSVPGQAPQKK